MGAPGPAVNARGQRAGPRSRNGVRATASTPAPAGYIRARWFHGSRAYLDHVADHGLLAAPVGGSTRPAESRTGRPRAGASRRRRSRRPGPPPRRWGTARPIGWPTLRAARSSSGWASQTSRRDNRPFRNSRTTALRARRYSTRPPVGDVCTPSRAPGRELTGPRLMRVDIVRNASRPSGSGVRPRGLPGPSVSVALIYRTDISFGYAIGEPPSSAGRRQPDR